MAEILNLRLDQLTPEQRKMLDKSVAAASALLDEGIAEAVVGLNLDALAGRDENISIAAYTAVCRDNLMKSEVNLATGAQLLAIAITRLARIELAKRAASN